jgi:hypothetical protein
MRHYARGSVLAVLGAKRTRAALFLVALVVVFAVGLRYRGGSIAGVSESVAITDPEVYDHVLARLRGGEPYYTVVGSELREHHYATEEVFNWRTPVFWSGLARLPVRLRHALLIALTLLVCLRAVAVAFGRSVLAAVVTGIAALGAGLLLAGPPSLSMGEAWAGGLVGLSVCAYARKRNRVGFGLGVAALFIRELVAPYTLICTFLAARERRWREVAAWLVAGIAYVVYYGVHLTRIWAHKLPTDLSSDGSWLAFGGLTFLLSTVQWNAFLIFSPWMFVALTFSLITAGVLAEKAPPHLRLTSAAYALMFLAIGQSFDRYWGLLPWPTWMLACGFGADAILSAVRVLVDNDPQTTTNVAGSVPGRTTG